jgi:hypothetical protein
MVSFCGVLHWQSGEGRRAFHQGPSRASMRPGLTRGISHPVVMLLQGKSLWRGPGHEIRIKRVRGSDFIHWDFGKV